MRGSGTLSEVECLACGGRRQVGGFCHAETAACPDCGYQGWAVPTTLRAGERERLHAALRHPLKRRSATIPGRL
jgi:hypothetical protein